LPAPSSTVADDANAARAGAGKGAPGETLREQTRDLEHASQRLEREQKETNVVLRRMARQGRAMGAAADRGATASFSTSQLAPPRRRATYPSRIPRRMQRRGYKQQARKSLHKYPRRSMLSPCKHRLWQKEQAMDTGREPRLSGKQHEIMKLLIANGELYGQEILRKANGALSRGTIYVTLDRLEDRGLVSSRQEDRAPGAIGLPRRMYKVTGLGQRMVEALELGRGHLAGLLGDL
jgi:hypothetical protein